MLNRNSWPRLGQLLAGGLITGAIALVLKGRGKILATNEVYPEAEHLNESLADHLVDQLWKLDLDFRGGLINSGEYAQKRADLLKDL